jgi:hypothetical protein
MLKSISLALAAAASSKSRLDGLRLTLVWFAPAVVSRLTSTSTWKGKKLWIG